MPHVLKKGIISIVHKMDGETDSAACTKAWFIASQGIGIPNIVQIANAWINKKLYNCQYNAELEKLIALYEENLFD